MRDFRSAARARAPTGNNASVGVFLIELALRARVRDSYRTQKAVRIRRRISDREKERERETAGIMQIYTIMYTRLRYTITHALKYVGEPRADGAAAEEEMREEEEREKKRIHSPTHNVHATQSIVLGPLKGPAPRARARASSISSCRRKRNR